MIQLRNVDEKRRKYSALARSLDLNDSMTIAVQAYLKQKGIHLDRVFAASLVCRFGWRNVYKATRYLSKVQVSVSLENLVRSLVSAESYASSMTKVRNEHMADKNDYPLVLRTQHIQEILSCGKEKVWELARSEGFPRMAQSRAIRVPREAFFHWLNTSALVTWQGADE